jgi:hypothetical protein
MARSSPRDKNMLVRRLNGALPDGKEAWEKVRLDCVVVQARLCVRAFA